MTYQKLGGSITFTEKPTVKSVSKFDLGDWVQFADINGDPTDYSIGVIYSACEFNNIVKVLQIDISTTNPTLRIMDIDSNTTAFRIKPLNIDFKFKCV